MGEPPGSRCVSLPGGRAAPGWGETGRAPTLPRLRPARSELGGETQAPPGGPSGGVVPGQGCSPRLLGLDPRSAPRQPPPEHLASAPGARPHLQTAPGRASPWAPHPGAGAERPVGEPARRSCSRRRALSQAAGRWVALPGTCRLTPPFTGRRSRCSRLWSGGGNGSWRRGQSPPQAPLLPPAAHRLRRLLGGTRVTPEPGPSAQSPT